ncbi:lytic murein transglycosylase [Brevirhabdus sp.]|uniref:lytic murein transglycosylase n=1 Tax=Brevirhabdus sp. TaxID=2004514 RepID=UPI004058E2A6
MRSLIALCGLFGLAFLPMVMPAQATVVDSSSRPIPRKETNIVQVAATPERFATWLQAFRDDAAKRGIRADTLDAALSDVKYREDVIARDRNQSEFTKQIWEYLDTAVSRTRVENGRRAMAANADLFARIEARYKVEAEVVAAIWGLESAYGTFRGNIPIVDALSTLAFDGRRGEFFADQLVAALQIVQDGDTDARSMTGSWAGAMGHTQFIPTSFLGFAVDFTGDGRRDIWSDDPADALASTAAYLRNSGWVHGQPWGMEVTLPEDFDYSQSGERIKKPAAAWNAMGVRTAQGAPVPEHGPSSILLPAGAKGAAFVIYKNFSVIETYNTADAYVIAVGHLSDRIKGRPAIRAGWPRGDRGLRFSEKQELQRLLTGKGFDTDGIDGIIGPNTIQAVREFQTAQGMVPDGYVSLDILHRLQ